MFIDELKLKNIGAYTGLNLKFSPLGINLIHGYNGSGKTQIVKAIIFALSGKKNLVNYKSGSNIIGFVELKICEGENSQTLAYKLMTNGTGQSKSNLYLDKQIAFHPEKSGHKEFNKILWNSLEHDKSPSLLFDVDVDDEFLVLNPDTFEIINRFVQDDKEIVKFWQNIYQQKNIELPSKFEFMSLGVRQIIGLANLFVNRYNSETAIPLICDDVFGLFDKTAYKFIYRLISIISKKNQVIITTHRDDIKSFIPNNLIKSYNRLEQQNRSQVASFYFRYSFPQTQSRFQVTKSPRSLPHNQREKPLKSIINTEGKTDWKHLKAALNIFQSQGEFLDLDIEFNEYEDEIKMGSEELKAICIKGSKIPQPRKTICIFDRDEAKIVNQMEGKNRSYKNWGNNMFSLVIPIPNHRQDVKDVCIELYYKNSEITSAEGTKYSIPIKR